MKLYDSNSNNGTNYNNKCRRLIICTLAQETLVCHEQCSIMQTQPNNILCMYKVSLPFHKYATNQPNQVETIHPQGQQALTDPIHNKVNLSTGIHQNMPAWHHTYIPCTQPQYIQSVDKFSKLHQPQQVQDS